MKRQVQLPRLVTSVGALRSSISGGIRAFIGGFLSEALTPREKTKLTGRLYNMFPKYIGTVIPAWGEKLAHWEQAWFTRRLPKAPASILVGGCGAGREVLDLIERGFQVDAFDLAPELAASTSQAVGDRGRVLAFGYEDLSASVLENANGLASPFASEKYDAVLLGWGSLTHVLDPKERSRLLRSLDLICPNGPILASFWCTNGFIPEIPKKTPTEQFGQSLGCKIAMLRGIAPQHGSMESFKFQRGFGCTFSPEEIEHLAQMIGRQLAWERDDTTYAHVTFSPR